MSTVQAESFLKAVKEDEVLGSEFKKCFEILQGQGDSTPKDQEKQVLNAVVELGKSKGFEFDADEARSAYQNDHGNADAELSDEELERVAGGKSDDSGEASNGYKMIPTVDALGIGCLVASAADKDISMSERLPYKGPPPY